MRFAMRDLFRSHTSIRSATMKIFRKESPEENRKDSKDSSTEIALETYRDVLNRLELTSPVDHPDLFKMELEIGEKGYNRLLDRKSLLEIWDVVGAGITGASVVSAPFVATTLFPAAGVLAWVGLGTAAATPPGWILAAGLASGTMWYFIRGWFLKDDHKVRKVPRYINTPLDLLAISLFDLMVPLMLRVAVVDGEICERERDVVVEVLLYNWGYNPQFIKAGLECIEKTLVNYEDVDGLAANLAKFAQSCPDIDEKKFCAHLVHRLERIADSDLRRDPEEDAAILMVQNAIDKQFSRKRIDLVQEWLSGIRSIVNRVGIKVPNGEWLSATRSFVTSIKLPRLRPKSDS